MGFLDISLKMDSNPTLKIMNGKDIAFIEKQMVFTDENLSILSDFYKKNQEYFSAKGEKILAAYFIRERESIENMIFARESLE